MECLLAHASGEQLVPKRIYMRYINRIKAWEDERASTRNYTKVWDISPRERRSDTYAIRLERVPPVNEALKYRYRHAC